MRPSINQDQFAPSKCGGGVGKPNVYAGRWGSNPRRPAWEAITAPTQVLPSKALTPTLSDACTAACTSEAENANADPSNAGHGEADASDHDQGNKAGGGAGDRADQGDMLASLAAAIAESAAR